MTKRELAAEVAALRAEVAALRAELAMKPTGVPSYPQPIPWRNPYVYPYVTTTAPRLGWQGGKVVYINARSAS